MKHAPPGTARPRPVSLLPGPVELRPEVQAALAQPAISHRSAEYLGLLDGVRARLRGLTSAPHVQLLVGSGTLANDVVAGQLATLPGRGLVVANGEFGARLLDHARRWGLAHDALELPWGAPVEPDALAQQLRPDTRWLWLVAHETSTGRQQDVPALVAFTRERGLELALDAVSWLGTAPADLAQVLFASGVSGKGFGAPPGLALVCHREPVPPRPDRLPRYLDLGLYAAGAAPPFTQPSCLLAAFAAALERYQDPAAAYRHAADLAALAHHHLARLGLQPLVPPAEASPAILTLALPSDLSSRQLGDHLRAAGYLASYESDYLLTRNWLQLAWMGGAVGEAELAGAFAALAGVVSSRRSLHHHQVETT